MSLTKFKLVFFSSTEVYGREERSEPRRVRSSTAHTLRSRMWIPLRAWELLCFSLYPLLWVGKAIGRSLIQGVLIG